MPSEFLKNKAEEERKRKASGAADINTPLEMARNKSNDPFANPAPTSGNGISSNTGAGKGTAPGVMETFAPTAQDAGYTGTGAGKLANATVSAPSAKTESASSSGSFRVPNQNQSSSSGSFGKTASEDVAKSALDVLKPGTDIGSSISNLSETFKKYKEENEGKTNPNNRNRPVYMPNEQKVTPDDLSKIVNNKYVQNAAYSAVGGVAHAMGAVEDTVSANAYAVSKTLGDMVKKPGTTDIIGFLGETANDFNRYKQKYIMSNPSAAEEVQKLYEKDKQELSEKYGELNKVESLFDQAIYATTNMAGSLYAEMVAGAIAPGSKALTTAASIISIGSTSDVEYTKNALINMMEQNEEHKKSGLAPLYSDDEMVKKAALAGAAGFLIEGVGEQIIGDTLGRAAGIPGTIARKILDKPSVQKTAFAKALGKLGYNKIIVNPAVTAVLKYVTGAAGEGTEEVIQGLLADFATNKIYNSGDSTSIQEYMESFAVGGIMGLMGALPNAVANTKAGADLVSAANDFRKKAESAKTEEDFAANVITGTTIKNSANSLIEKLRESRNDANMEEVDNAIAGYEWLIGQIDKSMESASAKSKNVEAMEAVSDQNAAQAQTEIASEAESVSAAQEANPGKSVVSDLEKSIYDANPSAKMDGAKEIADAIRFIQQGDEKAATDKLAKLIVKNPVVADIVKEQLHIDAFGEDTASVKKTLVSAANSYAEAMERQREAAKNAANTASASASAETITVDGETYTREQFREWYNGNLELIARNPNSTADDFFDFYLAEQNGTAAPAQETEPVPETNSLSISRANTANIEPQNANIDTVGANISGENAQYTSESANNAPVIPDNAETVTDNVQENAVNSNNAQEQERRPENEVETFRDVLTNQNAAEAAETAQETQEAVPESLHGEQTNEAQTGNPARENASDASSDASGSSSGKKVKKINNLAELKRALSVGTKFAATYHANHPETVGRVRTVTKAFTNKITSSFDDGKNFRGTGTDTGDFETRFEKASDYRFNGDTVDVLDKNGNVMYSLEIYDNAETESAKNEDSGKVQQVESVLKNQNEEIDFSSDDLTRKHGKIIAGKELLDSLNEKQKEAVALLRVYADVCGMDIELVRSTVKKNGEYAGWNGYTEGNRITIDINAGLKNISESNDMSKYAMMYTFGHEFVHWTQKNAPSEYAEYKAAVLDALKKSYGSNDEFEAFMKVSAYKSVYGNLEGENRSKVEDEVVAEYGSRLLDRSDFLENLASEHSNVFKRLHERFKDFAKRLNDYFDSTRGSAISESMADRIWKTGSEKEILSLYKKMANAAAENNSKQQDQIDSVLKNQDNAEAAKITQESVSEKTDNNASDAKNASPAENTAESNNKIERGNYTVTKNAERNSVEVKFDAKPSEAVRDAMKGLGMRWNKATSSWYSKPGTTMEAVDKAILDAMAENAVKTGFDTNEVLIAKAINNASDEDIQKITDVIDGKKTAENLTQKETSDTMEAENRTDDVLKNPTVKTKDGKDIDRAEFHRVFDSVLGSAEAADAVFDDMFYSSIRKNSDTVLANDGRTYTRDEFQTAFSDYFGSAEKTDYAFDQLMGRKYQTSDFGSASDGNGSKDAASMLYQMFGFKGTTAYRRYTERKKSSEIGSVDVLKKQSGTTSKSASSSVSASEKRNRQKDNFMKLFGENALADIESGWNKKNGETTNGNDGKSERQREDERTDVSREEDTQTVDAVREGENEASVSAGQVLGEPVQKAGGDRRADNADDGRRNAVVDGGGNRDGGRVRTSDGLTSENTDIASNESVSAAAEAEAKDEAEGKKAEKSIEEAGSAEIAKKSMPKDKGTDFVIGESLNLPSSNKDRFRANLDAIRIVKTLVAEGRYATPEEQVILSKFTGWGGIPDAITRKWIYKNAQQRAAERETFRSTETYSGMSEKELESWRDMQSEMVRLLTDEEYDAALHSTENAHYTSVDVIRAMYDVLRNLGFTGGRVLEPSCGSGNFMGAMPSDMKANTKFTAVELDPMTALVAKYLYPNADTRAQGFQDAKIADGFYDVAISNVPFSYTGVRDERYPEQSRSTLHDYFFTRSLDAVKDGGIVMFITSTGTMDKLDAGARDYIMSKADLLGAVRLPNNAFQKNAKTPVVTDILVLQKRKEGTPYNGIPFLNSEYHDYRDIIPGYTEYGRASINEYFIEHPEKVLGTYAPGHMYGRNTGIDVKPLDGKNNISDQIRNALSDITAKISTEKAEESAEEPVTITSDQRKEYTGALVLRDGKIFNMKNGELIPAEISAKEYARTVGALGIRDAFLNQIQMESEGSADAEENRKNLNRAYDSFVKKYGHLNDRENKKIILADPDGYGILSLETKGKGGKIEKSKIFTESVVSPKKDITSADNVSDALLYSVNLKGGIDLEYMGSLLGETEENVKAELLDTGTAFLDKDMQLVPREKYLSGNVRAKLREAEAIVGVDPRFQKNIDALKEVIPAYTDISNISVNLGANWIPDEVYYAFFDSILGRPYKATREWVKDSQGGYRISITGYGKSSKNNIEYGTERMPFTEIFKRLMNSGQIRVVDHYEENGKDVYKVNAVETERAQKKAEAVQKAFSDFIRGDEKVSKVVADIYNNVFNAYVNPKYDSTNLTVNGMNPEFTMMEHQKNAVQRVISSGGNVLLAHRVGAGKTFEIASSCMKLRELGISKKPVVIAPKSLTAQWGEEFLKYYPGAKLLVADETSFTAENRKVFTNRMKYGDYDAIILSYEQFEKIPLSPERSVSFMVDQRNQLIMARDMEQRNEDRKSGSQKKQSKQLTIKQLNKAIEALDNKINDLMSVKRDTDNIDFEEIGIDSLFVDEAHNFKNLMYTTRMNNVSGLGNKNGSMRAFDLFSKIKYLDELNGGRGTVFATATPVMNSMVEMYTMQRFLQEDRLKEMGIENFDAWAKTFGEVRNDMELNPSGTGYRLKETFAHFRNLPEMQTQFRSFADVVRKIPGLKIPKMRTGDVITVTCPASDFQKQYMKELVYRSQHLPKDASKDNMFKITGDGRKVSYSQRMIDPSLPYEENGKIYMCAENIVKEYQNSNDIKGTQLVFLDADTPKGTDNNDGKKKKGKKEKASADVLIDEEGNVIDDSDIKESQNLYRDLKARLVELGIPEKEIAFIHDAKTAEQKSALSDAMNSGEIRVLIGSTGKMGVGLNVQKLGVAIHHLDAPWRPGDIEQRDGRFFRQKNQNKEVAKYVYVTEGSFDARLWQLLNRKQGIIDQVMNGDDIGYSMEDIGEVKLSAAEIMASASGDDTIKRQFELQQEVKKLDLEYQSYLAERESMLTEKRESKITVANGKKYLKYANVYLEGYTGVSEDALPVINGEQVKDEKDLGKRIQKIVDALKDSEETIPENERTTFPRSFDSTNVIVKRSPAEITIGGVNITICECNVKYGRTGEIGSTKPEYYFVAEYDGHVLGQTYIPQDTSKYAQYLRDVVVSVNNRKKAVDSQIAKAQGVIDKANEKLNAEFALADERRKAHAELDEINEKLIDKDQQVLGGEVEDDDVQYQTREFGETEDSLDNYSRKEYNARGWAVESGFITKEERNQLMSTVADIRKNGYKHPKTADGKYIIETENKLIITDAKWDNPSIEEIYEFTENASVLKEELYESIDATRGRSSGKQSVEETLSFIRNVFGDGIINRRKEQDGISYEEYVRRREGRIRGETVGEVEERNFKKWFGNSKVVNADGSPKIVYHGTTERFTVFERGDIGYHVGTKAQAEDRVSGSENAVIMPLYANITNPLRTSMDFGDWHGKNVAEMLLETEQFEEGYDENAKEINDRLSEIAAMPDDKNTDAVMRDFLISLGYDGIEYENEFEDADYSGNNENSYIVFKPNQLKSAEDNIGTFDSENDDIRYQTKDFGETSEQREAEYAKEREETQNIADNAGKMEADAHKSAKQTIDRKKADEVLNILKKSSSGPASASAPASSAKERSAYNTINDAKNDERRNSVNDLLKEAEDKLVEAAKRVGIEKAKQDSVVSGALERRAKEIPALRKPLPKDIDKTAERREKMFTARSTALQDVASGDVGTGVNPKDAFTGQYKAPRRLSDENTTANTLKPMGETLEEDSKMRKKNSRRSLGEVVQKGKTLFLNSVQALDDLGQMQSRKGFENTAVELSKAALVSQGTTEMNLAVGMTDTEGNIIDGSFFDVMMCRDSTGEINMKMQQLLQDYMLHRHNIDRMSIRSRAKESLAEYVRANPWLITDSDDQLAERISKDKEARKIAYEYNKLYDAAKNAKDKPIFKGDNGEILTAEYSQAVVDAYDRETPWLKEKADLIDEWYDHFMRTWAVGTTISEEQYEHLRKLYPHYVPTYRELDKKAQKAAIVSRGAARIGDPIKEAVGSVKEVRWIHETFSDQIHTTIARYRVNKVYQNLYDTGILDSNGDFGNYVWITADDMGFDDILRNDGIDEVLADTGIKSTSIGGGRTNTLSLLIDGKRVTAHISTEMYQALSELNHGSYADAAGEVYREAIRIGHGATDWAKKFITGINPLFLVRNPIRDIQMALIQTQGKAYNFPKYVVQAIKGIVNDSDQWKAFKALGGVQMNYYSNESGAFSDYYYKSMKEKDKGFIRDFGGNCESMTRFAEYIGYLSEHGDTAENRLKAIKAAADITVDFSRSGTFGKLINAYVLYWNPGVQGTDKFFRDVLNSDKEGKAKAQDIAKNIVKRFGRSALVIGIPQILCALAAKMFKRDKEYEELSDYYKDNYYCLAVSERLPGSDKNSFIRIPKCELYGGIVGAPISRLIDSLAFGDKDAFNDIDTTLLEAFGVPTGDGIADIAVDSARDIIGFGQLLEIVQNEKFNGSKIVGNEFIDYSTGKQVSNWKQFNDDTSALGFLLGEVLSPVGLSPEKVDHLIYSYFGDFFSSINDLLDIGLFKTIGRGDIVGAGKDVLGNITSGAKKNVYADSRYSNQYVNKYYDELDDLKQGIADGDELSESINKAVKKMFGDEINGLYKQANAATSKGEQDDIRGDITVIAREALDFIEDAKNGKYGKDPSLYATYSAYGNTVANGLSEMEPYFKDYTIEPTNTTVKAETTLVLKTSDGKSYNLTLDEKIAYNNLRQQKYRQNMESVMNSKKYRKASGEDKATMLEKARSDAYDEAKKEYLAILNKRYKGKSHK